MKILIVKLSAFGDIIHTLPALDDLLSRPEVDEVHWLMDSRYAFVGEVLPKEVPRHEISMTVPDLPRTIRALRRIGFDVALDMQGLFKSSCIARSIARRVYGFDQREIREKPAAWLQQSVRFHPQERHVVQQYRRVARAPFVDDNEPDHPIPYAPPRIDIARTSLDLDSGLLQRLHLCAGDYIVLHLGGGWRTKQLPNATWLRIAKGLLSAGMRPVFSWGSAAEKKAAERLAAESGADALPERLGMSALVTLLIKAKAVVGADTGVLHLAAALNTSTVTFWGPSASWRSAPWSKDAQGARHWHIESNPACGPCFKRRCDHFICMDAIRAEDILEAIYDI